MTNRNTLPGYPLPLGLKLDKTGAQFSLFSRHATSVTLVLFSPLPPHRETGQIHLDPDINKTGDIWHIWVEGIRIGDLYGYRIDGPYKPAEGHRFNRHKLLLDPYAKAVTGSFQWNLADARGYDPDSPMEDLSFSTRPSDPGAPKCIVCETKFNWTVRPPRIPICDLIIYELHVRGFTFHESSGARHPGTFRGLAEKIPYLRELGVTAVELMPIQEFDEEENVNINPLTGRKLKNYWGYSTISFFAPKGRYSSGGAMGEQVLEFKEMVRAFHEAGIEVFLDVVFNHTAEGDHLGPTLCFRGIDNSIYYMLEKNRRFYKNYSGCGNTFNCNHPLARDFILDCLKYWVIEMHIDGFRFDLASILGRDQDGNILSNPPLLEKISEDPILRTTKIIAEAWDAAGAYQVGNFPGRWAEWNGKFRDDIRRFWRGDRNATGSFATRISGSSDLYEKERSPHHSINFFTCHDGFTLNDLVSYREKRNLENGEGDRDGESFNLSDNYGIEGPDATRFIDLLRTRQIKNFLATLFLSQGVPMLPAGDEFRRTQGGNNNPYCQDNEISWIDWTFLERNRELFRFCREMIRFRKDHPLLRRKDFFTGTVHAGFSRPDVTWHGAEPGKPDWGEDSRMISCHLAGEYAPKEQGGVDNDLYLIFNASLMSLPFRIPEPLPGRKWFRVIDTSLSSPDDIAGNGKEVSLPGDRYYVKKMSTVVLMAKE